MKQRVVAVSVKQTHTNRFSDSKRKTVYSYRREVLLECGHEMRAVVGHTDAHNWRERRFEGEVIPDVVACRLCARAGKVSDELNLTHTELCGLAGKWLRSTGGCSVVLVEPHVFDLELPDAIGWNSWLSTLIECKASRSDFRADSKKWHRTADRAMGNRRWFFAPIGVIPANELPDGWGLLEWDGRVVRVAKQTTERVLPGAACAAERDLLIAAMRKVQSAENDPPTGSGTVLP